MLSHSAFSMILHQLAPVVQTLDSAIHWINHYPLDNSIGFASDYPLDSDLSGGQRYPSFEQLGPVVCLFWVSRVSWIGRLHFVMKLKMKVARFSEFLIYTELIY